MPHAARTKRIYNGSSANRLFQRRDIESPSTILACGRFSPDKNFPFLVRAFARIAAEDARLVILGEGPRAPRRRGRGAGAWACQGRVELPGYRDPAPDYAQASCFAMTSTRETFGLVIIEALGSGPAQIVTTEFRRPDRNWRRFRCRSRHRATKRHSPRRHSTRRLLHQGDPRARRARADQFSMEVCADASMPRRDSCTTIRHGARVRGSSAWTFGEHTARGGEFTLTRRHCPQLTRSPPAATAMAVRVRTAPPATAPVGTCTSAAFAHRPR